MKFRIGQAILFLALFSLFVVDGCGKQTNKAILPAPDLREIPHYNFDKKYISFEEALRSATTVLVGEYQASKDETLFQERQFHVVDVLKGEVEEEDIYVREYIGNVSVEGEKEYTYISGCYNYIEGHKYILVLDRFVSAYYDHDNYTFYADIFLPLDDQIGFYMYYEPISEEYGSDSSEVIEYIQNTCKKIDTEICFYGSKPIAVNSFEELVKKTDFIFEVIVNKPAVYMPYGDAQAYDCTLVSIVKGELDNGQLSEIGGHIQVTCKNKDVTEGNSYLIFVTRPDDQSIVFTYSAKESVFDPDMKEEVERILTD